MQVSQVLLIATLAIGICSKPNEKATISKPECGENAKFTTGPPCPEICGVDHSDNRHCRTMNLVFGCFCKNHTTHIRSGDKECINRDDCDPPEEYCSSAKNETFAPCASSCGDETCDGKSKICAQSCQKRCTCQTGFKRNSTGSCVNPKHCA